MTAKRRCPNCDRQGHTICYGNSRMFFARADKGRELREQGYPPEAIAEMLDVWTRDVWLPSQAR